jgi:phospholipid/cholesterol/gamma-HCH transport system permease protein
MTAIGAPGDLARTPRSVAWIPQRARGVIAQTGDMLLLFVLALRAMVRTLSWRSDTIEQSWLLVKRCTLPLSLAIFGFGFGTIGTEAGQVLTALGAPDRVGGVFVVAAVRELATWATAMVVAGVGGTAICADLGARRIREEIDALQVLGVEPVRNLVVPRMLALALITPLLNLVAILVCTLSGILGTFVLYPTSIASFVATFHANFAVPDLIGSEIKTFIFGVIIAVVCCYKGLNTSGGAQGVGRAVNQAVVVSFVALWVFNYAFTSMLLASFPSLQGLR